MGTSFKVLWLGMGMHYLGSVGKQLGVLYKEVAFYSIQLGTHWIYHSRQASKLSTKCSGGSQTSAMILKTIYNKPSPN